MIKARLAFRNTASTQDLNETIAKIIDKGIFYGGTLGLNPVSLNITIAPFIAVGYDGMVSISDATETVTVIDGQLNYIVLFAKYEQRATPVTTVQVLSEDAWTNSVYKDYLITFARVDLRLGGYTGVSAAEVFYDDSDWADRAGKSSWRSSVATTGDLPILYNRDGDTRMVTSGYKPYVYKSATNTWVPAFDSEASIVNYSGGPAWYDSTTNPATTVELQLDKIITDLVSTTLGGGADKVGTGSRSNWLDGTVNTVSSIYDALEKIITDLSSVVGNGGSNKVGVGARTSWIDATTNPATSVYAAIEKIITDLKDNTGTSGPNASGAHKIGAATQNTIERALDVPDVLTLSPGSIGAQLLEVINAIGYRPKYNGDQTFTGRNSFDTSGSGTNPPVVIKPGGGSSVSYVGGLKLTASTYDSRKLQVCVDDGTGTYGYRTIMRGKANGEDYIMYPMSFAEAGFYTTDGTPDWTFNGAYWDSHVTAGSTHSTMFSLNRVLTEGTILTGIKIWTQPGAARATASDRMGIQLYSRLAGPFGTVTKNFSGSGVENSIIINDATANQQTFVQTVGGGSGMTILPTNNDYWITIYAGVTDSVRDRIYGIQLYFKEGEYLYSK